MKPFYSILFSSLFLFACTETGGTDEGADTEPSTEDPGKVSFDSWVRREVQAKLEIPATEKYTLRIYREYINSDTVQDAIITVNRLEYAMNTAIKNKQEVKMAESGFVGSFNYFFYYDGQLDKMSVPLPIPSSPGRELGIEFRPITSRARMDIVIDYRIRNSGWKNYYSVLNDHDLALTFQWKAFDRIGEDKPEALLHDFIANPDGIGYDIAIYDSEIDNYSPNIPDIYQYVPTITKRNELLFKFFFDRSAGKFRLYKEFNHNIKRFS